MPFKCQNENPVTCCLLLVQGAYYSFAVNETHVNVRPQMSYKSTNLAKLIAEHKTKYKGLIKFIIYSEEQMWKACIAVTTCWVCVFTMKRTL